MRPLLEILGKNNLAKVPIHQMILTSIKSELSLIEIEMPKEAIVFQVELGISDVLG